MYKGTESGKEIAGERVAGRTGKTVETFPRLLDVKDVAAMLGGVSPRTIWRWASSAGSGMPRPLKLGGLRRWRREDIESWIAAGCPDQGKTGGVK